MSDPEPLIVNVDDAPWEEAFDGDHWGAAWRVLTPGMRDRGGRLGVAYNRVPPGRSACPFHTHLLEDEVFFVIAGEGVLRYGEHVRPLRAGDCVSCPAGTGVAHQIANTSPDTDLEYLGIGLHEDNEICTYPDTGKVYVRALSTVGRLTRTPYMDGEPDRPRVFDLARG